MPTESYRGAETDVQVANLGKPGLWVLELFAIYVMDGQTNGQTDGRTKTTLIAPSLQSGA